LSKCKPEDTSIILSMGYEEIDDILLQWATDRNLPMYKSYKDAEVRSFAIVNLEGKRFQIWVDEPDETNRITVHVWDCKKKTDRFPSTRESLYGCLEKAYHTIEAWENDLQN
jgi:hypothetical protein